MENAELAVKLANAETEGEVIDILKNEQLWENLNCWRPYGDTENNISTFGNQQNSADAALVEKLINSVDAILMKECILRGIEPESPAAPQSISEALALFFGIRSGQLTTMSSRKRNEMSESIILAATGKSKGEENLVIVDRGEGQTPTRMPDTILSISKSNKLKIPFVQGKFNMGGTGAIPFCGNNHIQLVISRRCPAIADKSDPLSNEWSVTVVRKEVAREGRRSSMYTYLTDDSGNILHFESEKVNIIPNCPGKETEDMIYGTFIKLYNYQISGYKTNILFDLNYRLSLLIPELAHPIRIRECRNSFKGNTLFTTLSGMTTRLYDDREGNVEEGFPSSNVITVDSQELLCSIYLFKKDKQKNYRNKHEGILFTVNGHTHGILQDTFFNKINYSYIKDSILVIVDCSKLDITHQEELFMTSRDRLRNSDFTKSVFDQLETTLRDHEGLKYAESQRRTSALKDKIDDDKPLKDVLKNIISKSSILTKLFITGNSITVPVEDHTPTGTPRSFKGKSHPTYFKIIGKMKDGVLTKHTPINHSFRIQFETDVQNDYFYRPTDSGYLVLKMDGKERPDLRQSLNLFNGIATLTVCMPKNAEVGEKHLFETMLVDDCILDSMENKFTLIIDPAREYGPGGQGGQRKTNTSGNQDGKKQDESLAIPEIVQIHKNEWLQYDMNEYSALKYIPTDQGGDYLLNMDNAYLLMELKGKRDTNKIEITKNRFLYSMALIAMSIIGHYKNKPEDNEGNIDIGEEVEKITTMISPILLPMLETMADLNISLPE